MKGRYWSALTALAAVVAVAVVSSWSARGSASADADESSAQAAFSDAVTAVFSEIPEGYVQSLWSADGGTIYVTPEASSDAQRIADRFPGDVSIQVVDAPSLGDQDELARQVMDVLLGSGIDRPTAVRYDLGQDALVITLWEDGRPLSEAERALAESVGKDFAQAIGAGVEVDVLTSAPPTHRD